MARDDKRSTPQSVGTFNEAFKQARESGVNTFMWKGKEYTTDLKEDVKETAPSKSKRSTVNYPPYWKKNKGGKVEYNKGGKVRDSFTQQYD